MPRDFHRVLIERYGPEIFVTSVTGDSAHVYPLEVWEEIERKLAEMPSANKAKQRYLARVNYFGQQLKLDAQGRGTVPQILREKAEIVGDVVVSGRLDHLEIWNRERFEERLHQEPFDDTDFDSLADLGL